MAMYYNADGVLQEFNEWTNIIECPNCGKPYRQNCEEQVPGFRERSEDICPYCDYERSSSMDTDYFNSKLSDAEIEEYQKLKKKLP